MGREPAARANAGQPEPWPPGATASPALRLIFALVLVAALARIAAALAPLGAMMLLGVAALCWSAAFFGFCAAFWNLLTKPKSGSRASPDAHPRHRTRGDAAKNHRKLRVAGVMALLAIATAAVHAQAWRFGQAENATRAGISGGARPDHAARTPDRVGRHAQLVNRRSTIGADAKP